MTTLNKSQQTQWISNITISSLFFIWSRSSDFARSWKCIALRRRSGGLFRTQRFPLAACIAGLHSGGLFKRLHFFCFSYASDWTNGHCPHYFANCIGLTGEQQVEEDRAGSSAGLGLFQRRAGSQSWCGLILPKGFGCIFFFEDTCYTIIFGMVLIDNIQIECNAFNQSYGLIGTPQGAVQCKSSKTYAALYYQIFKS